MNNLVSFMQFALTKSEMREVVGGGCTIYFDYFDYGSNTHVCNYFQQTKTNNISQQDAVNYADGLVGKPLHNGFISGYSVQCS